MKIKAKAAGCIAARILLGVLITLLAFFIKGRVEWHDRYMYCIKHNLSYFDFNDADRVWEDEAGYTYYQYYGRKACIKGGETVFYDDSIGCVYFYESGILKTILIGQYRKQLIDYKTVTVRTPEEVESFIPLLEKKDREAIMKKGGYFWETASGEMFVN